MEDGERGGEAGEGEMSEGKLGGATGKGEGRRRHNKFRSIMLVRGESCFIMLKSRLHHHCSLVFVID